MESVYNKIKQVEDGQYEEKEAINKLFPHQKKKRIAKYFYSEIKKLFLGDAYENKIGHK